MSMKFIYRSVEKVQRKSTAWNVYRNPNGGMIKIEIVLHFVSGPRKMRELTHQHAIKSNQRMHLANSFKNQFKLLYYLSDLLFARLPLSVVL